MISVSKMKTIYTYASEHGDEDASEHFDVSVKTIKRYVQLYRNTSMTVFLRNQTVLWLLTRMPIRQ